MTSNFNTHSRQRTITNSNLLQSIQFEKHTNLIKKSYQCIDITKFFFAICIVALHTEALSFLPDTIYYMVSKIVFRCAVPYFFVATGFFFGKKLLDAPKTQYTNIIGAYCMRLLKPLIVFEVISLIYYGLTHLHSGKSIISTLHILLRTIIFYPYGALWFVQACILGVILLYPFLKKDKICIAILTGLFLYCFALIANNYSFIIVDTPFQKIVDTYMRHCISARNGLFVGFIFIALGIICNNFYEKVCKWKKIKLVLVSLSFFVIYLIEIVFIYCFNKAPLDDGALYISHLFFIPALFILTLQINIPIPTKISVLLRNLSTGVYFLHRPILYITASFISTGWLNFLIVSFIAIFVCLLAYKTQFKCLNSLLK